MSSEVIVLASYLFSDHRLYIKMDTGFGLESELLPIIITLFFFCFKLNLFTITMFKNEIDSY